MKQIISITDITAYLYCPRKVYLKLVKKIKEPPTKQMISGFLKHKIFDIFNKNEQVMVSSILNNLEEKEIKILYNQHLTSITYEVLNNYQNMVKSFSINSQELIKDVLKFMEREINLRAESIKKTLDLGFKGKELWRNLKPKYLTEFEIISEGLGLKGRIDRIKFDSEILPYEIKTREEVYQSDKLQLAAYSLLLQEEFKREINKGIIETSSLLQEINIDENLKSQVLEIAEKIRNLKQGDFQSNFNKCKSCRLRKECFEL